MSALHRVQAYAQLWTRYRSVFGHFWRDRAELDLPSLRDHEAEFLPAAIAIQVQPVSPVGRLVAYVLVALTVAVAAWSALGQVDIVVNATGKVIPSAHTKTIASVETASVREIHVREGQRVKAGQLLVELDASVGEAERGKAQGTRIEALLQVARAKAMLAALDAGHVVDMAPVAEAPPQQWQAEQRHFLGQYADFAAKLKTIDGDVARFSQALPLAVEQERDYDTLSRTRDVSVHASMQKQEARIELDGQLRDAINRREALLAETRRVSLDSISDGYKQAADSAQEVQRTNSEIRLLKLTSPVDGTVQQLTVFTVGGIVSSAQALMQIVPADSALEVEATLQNKDIGFVKEGQTAAIKVTAYDYTKYGTTAGKVMQISRDAIQDDKHDLVYNATIGLQQPFIHIGDRDVALTPGLAVDVEIKTGRRRLIEYILSPLIQHGHESLNER